MRLADALASEMKAEGVSVAMRGDGILVDCTSEIPAMRGLHPLQVTESVIRSARRASDLFEVHTVLAHDLKVRPRRVVAFKLLKSK